MRIYIVLNQPYPHGMACTNRVHLYAKGLKMLGNEVKVLVPRPTEPDGRTRNDRVKGVYDGVEYEYCARTTKRSSSFWKRRFHDTVGAFFAFSAIVKGKADIVLLVSNSVMHAGLFKLSSILTTAKLVREKSEVPYFHKESLSIMNTCAVKLVYSWFDGIVVISEALRDFFTNEMSLSTRILVLPIIVEKDERSNSVRQASPRKTLVYGGSLSDKKDGVTIVIEAFTSLMTYSSEYSLVLTGDLDRSPDKSRIQEIVVKNDLQHNVQFTGFLARQELQELLASASALLLAKPDNRQNRYNSATKIGEYLLSGRPVIMSSCDTASAFLTHGQNAFVVQPTVGEFAQAMQYVIEHPTEASQIGRKGREIALKQLDYLSQTTRLNKFLESLRI